MPLPAADASGRIQQVGRLPLDQISAGTYELRVVVKQGDRTAGPHDDPDGSGVADSPSAVSQYLCRLKAEAH